MESIQRYRTLNRDLIKTFGQKTIKLSVNGGFSCPNRDGSKGLNGCIFCSEMGSGDFAGNVNKSITLQLADQIHLLSKKWPAEKYIAYFGAFTNTYGDIKDLRKKYEEALAYPGVVGIAIATRPDCLSKEVLSLLDEINQETFLWIELGLQTIHEDTARLIRRGYDLDVFESNYRALEDLGILTVVHLILGLPGESKSQMLQTVDYVSAQLPWGVKLHLMHIVKGTDLETLYYNKEFALLQQKEYVDWVCDALERLDSSIIIHRLTGDGKKATLIGPLWSLNKLQVLADIRKELVRRNTWQGSYLNQPCVF